MKIRYLFLAFLALAGCEAGDKPNQTETQTDTPVIIDSLNKPSPTFYSNQRFRNVSVERPRDSIFVIKGQAQVFEANFNWVVEDGHNELRAGHVTTSAGAPEWGDF